MASPTGGHPSAVGRIVNNSSKASAYVIQVSFKDPSGNNVSAGAATVGKVESKATGTWRASGANDVKGGVTCKVSSVARTAAP
jgi:hypothetical protein